jgi:tetratricopeptide (TPR) repeat protein
VDGVSLFEGDPPAGRGAYFETYYGYLHYGWSPLVGWVDREGKYLHSSDPEFYRPRRDPAERFDRLVENEAELARYRAAITGVNGRPCLPRERNGRARPRPDLGRDSAALGGASGAASVGPWPDPLAASDRPSPRSRVQEMIRLEEGMRHAEAGDHARAVELYADIARSNPANVSVREYLAQSLVLLHRFEEAHDVLREVLALGVERAATYVNLADCLHAAGRDAEAVASLRRALELDPGFAAARAKLDYLLGAAGPRGEARSGSAPAGEDG